MKEQSKSRCHAIGRFIAVPVAALILFAPFEALAVETACKRGMCGRTTWDGSRVTIYFETEGGAGSKLVTHYNFKLNNAEGITGQQIELRTTHYSFDARKGQSGKYFLQACLRRPMGASNCTRWADFWWKASKR